MTLETKSRECQDVFISTLFNYKKKGSYIEIGSQHPVIDSNTYLLEKKLEWFGISFEINEGLVKDFLQLRKNPCIHCDATDINYEEIFEKYNMPKNIDFLQLDIEPGFNTFTALKKINFDKYSFNFITFEHEFYKEGDTVRTESRNYLKNKGYKILIENVMHENLPFEDWYVRENYFNSELIEFLAGKNINMDYKNIDKKYYNYIIKSNGFNRI